MILKIDKGNEKHSDVASWLVLKIDQEVCATTTMLLLLYYFTSKKRDHIRVNKVSNLIKAVTQHFPRSPLTDVTAHITNPELISLLTSART